MQVTLNAPEKKSYSYEVVGSTTVSFDQNFRWRLSSRLSAAIGIFFLVGGYLRNFVEPLPPGYLWYPVSLAAIFFVIAFVLKRSQKTIAIWTAILNLVFIVAILTSSVLVGGIRAPIFGVLIMLPALGFLVGGRRLGTLNLIAGVLAFSGAVALETVGAVSMAPDHPGYRAVVYSFLVLLSYSLGLTYETLWSRSADTAMTSARLAGLGKLATGVAQEIKDPLNIIVSESKIIAEFARNDLQLHLSKLKNEITQEDLKDLGDDLREIIRLCSGLERASKHADSAASSLLLQARTGRSELQKCDLILMVENNLSFAYNIMRMRHPVGVSVDFVKSHIPKTFCYPRELNRFLLNIFDNALYALYEKHLKVTSHAGVLKVRVFESVEFIEFEITDNGVGIPKSELPRIFEPFYSTRKNSESVGLGLSHSYDVASMHKGFVTVSSVEGEGTSFVLKISKNLKESRPHFQKIAA